MIDGKKLAEQLFDPQGKVRPYSGLSRETKDALWEVLTAVVTVASCPIIFAWHGWVVQRMWAWFATPVTGVAAPGLAVCVGIDLMVGFLTNDDYANSLAMREAKPSALLRRLIFRPMSYLTFAFVLHRLGA